MLVVQFVYNFSQCICCLQQRRVFFEQQFLTIWLNYTEELQLSNLFRNPPSLLLQSSQTVPFALIFWRHPSSLMLIKNSARAMNNSYLCIRNSRSGFSQASPTFSWIRCASVHFVNSFFFLSLKRKDRVWLRCMQGLNLPCWTYSCVGPHFTFGWGFVCPCQVRHCKR